MQIFLIVALYFGGVFHTPRKVNPVGPEPRHTISWQELQ